MSLTKHTPQQHANLTASFLPEGRAWSAKYVSGTNFRRIMTAFSVEQKRFYDLMVDFLSERDPRTTNNYLKEWESALSIPDDCIPLAVSVQDRRDNITLKLTSLSVQTEEDYVNLALVFGFNITFGVGGSGGFPYTFPVTFPEPAITFAWVISGNFLDNTAKATIFQCLVEALKPAIYAVEFNNT